MSCTALISGENVANVVTNSIPANSTPSTQFPGQPNSRGWPRLVHARRIATAREWSLLPCRRIAHKRCPKKLQRNERKAPATGALIDKTLSNFDRKGRKKWTRAVLGGRRSAAGGRLQCSFVRPPSQRAARAHNDFRGQRWALCWVGSRRLAPPILAEWRCGGCLRGEGATRQGKNLGEWRVYGVRVWSWDVEPGAEQTPIACAQFDDGHKLPRILSLYA